MNKDKIIEILKKYEHTIYTSFTSNERGIPSGMYDAIAKELSALKAEAEKEVSELLPCGHKGCQNPHERIYRGCDICEFNKVHRDNLIKKGE